MSKINENEIELLEAKISDKLNPFKELKTSERNESYFNTLHNRTMDNLGKKKNRFVLQLNPAISYALLFLISFITSFQLIDLGKMTKINEVDYLFSESTLWIEEENDISNLVDDSFDLDYASYFNNEIDYFTNVFYDDEIDQLSKNDLEEIYENIKNKKIL